MKQRAGAKQAGVQLVVVGSIGLDDIETPTEKHESLLGGSVSYACAAASFFCRTGMVGVVGSDFPPRFLSLYRRFGIDLDGLQRLTGKTFRWSGVYEADMINRRTLSTELNVFASFQPDLPEAYRAAPFLLLGNISPDLQLHVLEQVRGPRFIVADTMDLWIRIARDRLAQVIEHVHMLTLNDSEARELTGEHNIRRCAADILEMGPRYVVIKRGEHGAMLFSKQGMTLIPAYPVAGVRDPTGAGDCFAGAFMGALAAAGSLTPAALKAALLQGSVVASFNVEAFSLGRLTTLRRPAITARLRELKRMLPA